MNSCSTGTVERSVPAKPEELETRLEAVYAELRALWKFQGLPPELDSLFHKSLDAVDRTRVGVNAYRRLGRWATPEL
jgi:hypothetical protein